MRRAYRTTGRVCGASGKVRLGALLNFLLNVLALNIDDSEYYLTMEFEGIEVYIEMT